MKKSRTAAALAIAALALGATATTAQAEDTVATFEVTASGALGISIPSGSLETPLSLGTTAADAGTFTPQLGTVTVTDTRAELVADWTATATGSHFDLQTAGADPVGDVNQRVNNTAISYDTLTPSVTTGTGVATPTVGTLLAGGLVAYVGSGNNTVTWNPTVTMTILPTQVAGTYQGTVTHSVTAAP